jgi:hypothetical protein
MRLRLDGLGKDGPPNTALTASRAAPAAVTNGKEILIRPPHRGRLGPGSHSSRRHVVLPCESSTFTVLWGRATEREEPREPYHRGRSLTLMTCSKLPKQLGCPPGFWMRTRASCRHAASQVRCGLPPAKLDSRLHFPVPCNITGEINDQTMKRMTAGPSSPRVDISAWGTPLLVKAERVPPSSQELRKQRHRTTPSFCRRFRW